MFGDGGGSASGAEALQQPAEEDIAALVSKMGLQIPESWDRVGMEKTAVENDAAVSAAYAKFAPESKAAEPTVELAPLEQFFKTVAEDGGKFPGHSHTNDAKALEKAFLFTTGFYRDGNTYSEIESAYTEIESTYTEIESA